MFTLKELKSKTCPLKWLSPSKFATQKCIGEPCAMIKQLDILRQGESEEPMYDCGLKRS
jgi:hypothetical protein